MDLLQDISAEPTPISSVLVCFAKGEAPSSVAGLPEDYDIASSADGRNHLAYRRRIRLDAGPRADQQPIPPVLILGDYSEWNTEFDGRSMANSTALACRLDEGRLEAITAIPGMPPLYLANTSNLLVLASDLSLLNAVKGLSLRFDPLGVADLARIGRPVGHRTLFAGVQLVPGGTRLEVTPNGNVAMQSSWEPPSETLCRDWEEYAELQAEEFGQTMARLDYQDCMLSLSGGLDTRAILAGLISNGAEIPAVTVTGKIECLDARIASKLSATFGIEHRIVMLDEAFCRSLPDLAMRSSLLSGGVSSVGHAARVYCYDQLGTPPGKMLSGHLGNQIGRLGTEGLTPRLADTELLNGELVEPPEASPPVESWYAGAMQPNGHLETRFLIQQEALFASLPSYAIGNTHSVQQSPYGSRALIENLWRMPASGRGKRGNARIHDLKHRFIGPSLEESFQRRYVNKVGGPLANIPINWGWRSRGGASVPGLSWGALALVDAIVSSRFGNTGAMRLLGGLRIAGLHEYRDVHQWLYRDLKDFVCDLLSSRDIVESDLFHTALLQRKLEDYYKGHGGRDNDVLLVLDLALAARNFAATV